MTGRSKHKRKNVALRIRLAEFDMSFAELARRANLHPITVSRVYNGQFTFGPATAERVAAILETTPEELGLLRLKNSLEGGVK